MRHALAFAILLPALAHAQEPVRPGADTLPDSAVTLPPFTITAARTPAGPDRSPYAATVITRGDLGRARTGLGLDDVLAGIPGVLVANRYNFSLDQRLSIRGFGSRSSFGLRGVKVLLDGVPQTLPDGQGQLSNVDFGLVERAEIVRGPASSLHGNASGGVVSLESMRPGTAPLAARLRAEGGSFGLFRTSGGVTARRGGTAGAIAFSRYRLDGFREQSAAENLQLNLVAERELGAAHRVSVRFAHSDAPVADNPGALTRAELDADPSGAAPNNLARDAGKQVSQQQASFAWRYGSGPHSVDATIFGIRRDLENPLATGVFIDLDRRAGGARLAVTRGLGAGWPVRVTVGADLQAMRDERRNLHAPQGTPTDSVLLDQRERVTETGPFLQLAWTPSSRWLLSGGVRYDRVAFTVADRHLGDGADNSGTRVMSAWSGHLGTSLSLGVHTLYANLGTAFETPTTTELVNQPGGTGGFNDEVGPQSAVSLEAGIRGRGEQVSWSLAAFRARVEDALVPFSEVGGRSFFTNAGRLAQDGIEAGLEVAASSRVAMSAAWTVARYRLERYRVTSGNAVDTLDGNELPGVPAHSARIALRVEPVGNVRVDLEQQLGSSYFADDRNTIEVEGWGAGITTVRVELRARAGRWELVPFAGVHNLFAREYVASVTVNGFGGRVFEPGPGRNGWAGMEVRIGHR